MQSTQEDAKRETSSSIAPATAPAVQGPSLSITELKISSMLERTDVSAKLLDFILSRLTPEQQPALSSRDSLGRSPLHYAAHFGFAKFCGVITRYMESWGQPKITDGLDSPVFFDEDGNSPLHLSIIGG